MPYDDEDIEDREAEPSELPEVVLSQPGTCACGKRGCTHGCFKCGHAVCMDKFNYLADTKCGSWILDSWHNDAPGENEFWCKACSQAS